MSLSHTLWQANADLAQACLDQPFVRGIGDGSLPRPRFAGYIGQDAFYLQAFARAYAIAPPRRPIGPAFGNCTNWWVGFSKNWSYTKVSPPLGD